MRVISPRQEYCTVEFKENTTQLKKMQLLLLVTLCIIMILKTMLLVHGAF